MDLQHVRRLTVSGSVKICGSTNPDLRSKIFNKTCLKSFSKNPSRMLINV